jgi:hypothetical protein
MTCFITWREIKGEFCEKPLTSRGFCGIMCINQILGGKMAMKHTKLVKKGMGGG